MTPSEMATLGATTIQNGLVSAGIAVSPQAAAAIAAIQGRSSCWKGIFSAISAWVAVASPQELASLWQSLITTCNQAQSSRPALPLLYAQRSNASALQTMWQNMPPGTTPELQLHLAANPLLWAMFQPPTPTLTNLPAKLSSATAAYAIWTHVLKDMTALSNYDAVAPAQ